MNRLAACVYATLLAFSNVQAEPASTTSVETLLALTKSDRLLTLLYANMEQSMGQGMRAASAGHTLSPEQQRSLDAAPAKFAAVMRSELGWEALRPILVSVYTETFDQEEVDGLITFYRSPVGQRFVDKQPLVAQRTSVAMQELMKSFIPKLQAAMQSVLQDAGVK